MRNRVEEGECTDPDCPKRTKFIGNKSLGLCLDCNARRLLAGRKARAANKPKKQPYFLPYKQRKPPKPTKRRSKPKRVYRRKKTGEKDLFMVILLERGSRSEISGEFISRPAPINFMHVLSKGAYPSLRLEKENIVIATANEHHVYDNGDLEKLKQKPEWKFVFEKREQLKQKFYQNN